MPHREPGPPPAPLLRSCFVIFVLLLSLNFPRPSRNFYTESAENRIGAVVPHTPPSGVRRRLYVDGVPGTDRDPAPRLLSPVLYCGRVHRHATGMTGSSQGLKGSDP